MRRLTLILSDLYLPEEAHDGQQVPVPLALPALSWLLRFARKSSVPGDWRHWLVSELGLSVLSGKSIAEVAASAGPEGAGGAYLATPVYLSARLDHVRLVDRGLLRVAPAEQVAWANEFARHFGPEFVLCPGNERGFILRGLASRAATTDPARLLDADVAPALPPGTEGLVIRRLSAEIEMWLHASPLNEARQRAGAPRISALWLWGGGVPVLSFAQMPVASAPHVSIPTASIPTVSFHGGDPFLAGLAAAMRATMSAVPERFAALGSGADHVVVELAPMTGEAHESLASLEDGWFAPARRALVTGEWSAVEIVANDTKFRITRRAGWRFWRSRRDWLRILAGRTPARQA